PFALSSFRIDRAHSSGRWIIHASRAPSHILLSGFVAGWTAEKSLARVLILEIHPSRRRIIRRSLKICSAAEAWKHDIAVHAGVPAGHDFRAAVVIEPCVPGLPNKRNRGQEFSVGAIEHIEETVSIGMEDQLAVLSFENAIDKDHVFGRVPIVR